MTSNCGYCITSWSLSGDDSYRNDPRAFFKMSSMKYIIYHPSNIVNISSNYMKLEILQAKYNIASACLLHYRFSVIPN